VAFFVAAAVMLPLALGPAPARLAAVSGGFSWVALSLASLLSLDRMFERDFEDGALDLLALGPLPMEVVAAVKCLAQWTAAGAPLALAAPVVAVSLGARPACAPMILVAAGLGGLAFAFLGGAGAALALASRRGGVLIAVVVLPLLTPPVIFGGAAIETFAGGLPWIAPLSLLAAYALACVALAPFAMAAACRNAQS
jgi:heme exporter protein B